jgi:hypothetical protein
MELVSIDSAHEETMISKHFQKIGNQCNKKCHMEFKPKANK